MRVLKELHEGSSYQGLMHDLHMATDYARVTTKVATWALGRSMATLVV